MSRPLALKLDSPDDTFTYFVEVNSKTQRCSVIDASLACRIDKLALAYGAQYEARVLRSFADKVQDSVAKLQVAVLPAVKVMDSSVKESDALAGKVHDITLTVDKPIIKADAILEVLEGDSVKVVPTSVNAGDRIVTIKLNEEIAREKQFRLTLLRAVGEDGSDLAEPYVLKFRTLGGPKVTAVNIGSSGVLPGTRVVVSFDQQLKVGADVSRYASITGGGAAVTMDGSQVVFALRDVPACGSFTLKIVKGLPGANDLVAESDWSFNSKLSCRAATRTIGYSVKGRPIVAYYYGSGATTVLFTGGIHGSERSGSYIMQDWVAHLDEHADQIPSGRSIVVVPNLNPDGLAVADRYNANGVNLDRNFPSSDWATDIGTREGIKAGGGGSSALSEPEAQAIAALTQSLRPRLVLSYHASGNLVGINKVGDSVAVGNAYAAAVGYTTMYDNAEEIMGYSFTGEYETWIGEKLGAPAVLIELPNTTGRFFAKHVDVLWKMVGI